MGVVKADTKNSDLRWLHKAEHLGEWRRFSETELAEPESIWMMKSTTGPAVRFYAVGKGQIGQQHSHEVEASMWAWANRWVSVDMDTGLVHMPAQLACRQWVQNGGANCTGGAH